MLISFPNIQQKTRSRVESPDLIKGNTEFLFLVKELTTSRYVKLRKYKTFYFTVFQETNGFTKI